MPPVWQSLIPETSSTEPIAPPSPLEEPLNHPSGLFSSYHHNHHHHGISLHLPNSSPFKSPHPLKNRSNHFSNNNNNNGNQRDSQYQQSESSNNNHVSGRKSGLLSRISSLRCWEMFQRLSSDRSRKHLDKKNETGKRYFFQNGVYNTKQINVFEKTTRYIRDIFTTLVDTKWRWTLIVFSVSYVLSWFGFALIWWIILITHGDIEHGDDPSWQPCVVGVKTFASVFLFSLETQHTIGYGTRFMNDNCPDAIVALICQSIAGILIEAFLVGVVFAKLSRPKKRALTLVFSRNAVISQRDGKMYLMFRVADLRNRSSLLEAHVRAQVITKRVTLEGEEIPIYQEEIKVGGYGEDEERILLFWPTIIVHPIDPDSPFYTMSARELAESNLELVIVLEGVVESTGMTTQLRTSYLPQEILWGRRFHDLGSFKSESGRHVFDFKLFHSTFPVDTPVCSAQCLDNINSSVGNGIRQINGKEITISIDRGDEESSASYSTGTGSPVNQPNSIQFPGPKTLGNENNNHNHVQQHQHQNSPPNSRRSSEPNELTCIVTSNNHKNNKSYDDIILGERSSNALAQGLAVSPPSPLQFCGEDDEEESENDNDSELENDDDDDKVFHSEV